MMIDDRNKPSAAAAASAQTAQAQAAQKRQAGELPPGSLENAFERAKARLAIHSGEPIEEYAA